MKTPREIIDNQISEADWQRDVVILLSLKGWSVEYIRPGRVIRAGKETYETPVGADGKGAWDIRAFRERLVIIECKSMMGRLTKSQELWDERYTRAGIEHYILRPQDWDRLLEIAK